MENDDTKNNDDSKTSSPPAAAATEVHATDDSKDFTPTHFGTPLQQGQPPPEELDAAGQEQLWKEAVEGIWYDKVIIEEVAGVVTTPEEIERVRTALKAAKFVRMTRMPRPAHPRYASDVLLVSIGYSQQDPAIEKLREVPLDVVEFLLERQLESPLLLNVSVLDPEVGTRHLPLPTSNGHGTLLAVLLAYREAEAGQSIFVDELLSWLQLGKQDDVVVSDDWIRTRLTELDEMGIVRLTGEDSVDESTGVRRTVVELKEKHPIVERAQDTNCRWAMSTGPRKATNGYPEAVDDSRERLLGDCRFVLSQAPEWEGPSRRAA